MSLARRPLAWNELLALGFLGLFWGLGPALVSFGDLFKIGSDQPYVYGWGRMLHELPLRSFYRTDLGSYVHFPHPNPLTPLYGRPDHLPSDMAALKLLELVYSALGGTAYTSSWLFLFALFQVLNAVALAFGLYLLVRRLLGPGSGESVVLLVALLDPLVPIAAYLLRWDFFSADLAVWFLVALTVTRSAVRWPLVGALGALVVLSKPQYVLVLAPALVWRCGCGRPPWRAVLRAATLAGAAAAATAGALLWPFRLGPRSLVELSRYAFGKFPYATDAAGNLWGLVRPQHRLATADGGYVWTVTLDRHTVAGLSCLAWGWVVFAVLAAAAAAVAATWRRDGLTKAMWLATVVYLGYWWATTRQTERYLLPALIVSLLLAASSARGRGRLAWSGAVLLLWVGAVAQVAAANWDAVALPWTAWLVTIALAALLLLPLAERPRSAISPSRLVEP